MKVLGALGFVMGILHSSRKSSEGDSSEYPVVCGNEVMSKKEHGTCTHPPQDNLRWGCSGNIADRICCFNRHYAENSGYWKKTSFIQEMKKANLPVTFYDSVSGKPLFMAPVGRTLAAFLKESNAHGWPSFRDEEVIWENTRCLKNGECVSLSGTHLGHNIPDSRGNRYCINLVSIAGNLVEE